MIAEFLWNTCASRKIDVLSKVFPGVTRFVDDQPESTRDLVAWAYGPTMSAGLKRVLQELRDDPGSRRAVVTLSHPFSYADQLGGGTPPCLVSAQFLLRDNKLDMIITMRSNDIWRGFPLDVYQFSMWQIFLAAALKAPVGTYYHYVGSLHLYERDREAAVKMRKGIFRPVLSHRPHEDALEDLLHYGGSDIIDTLRDDVLPPPTVQMWTDSYHGRPHPMCEFGWLKANGYGVW
jgi:hypothetical protein